MAGLYKRSFVWDRFAAAPCSCYGSSAAINRGLWRSYLEGGRGEVLERSVGYFVFCRGAWIVPETILGDS